MDKDQQGTQDGQEDSLPEDVVFDIGTDPVGESDGIYVIGTDTVIGSQPAADDGIYVIGTDVVGKSVDPAPEERSGEESDE